MPAPNEFTIKNEKYDFYCHYCGKLIETEKIKIIQDFCITPHITYTHCDNH